MESLVTGKASRALLKTLQPTKLLAAVSVTVTTGKAILKVLRLKAVKVQAAVTVTSAYSISCLSKSR